jgi:hypothetical protein
MNDKHAVPSLRSLLLTGLALGVAVMLRRLLTRVAGPLGTAMMADRALLEVEGVERFCRRAYESALRRRVPLRPGGRVIVRLVRDCPDPIERVAFRFIRVEEHADEARRGSGCWIVLGPPVGDDERYWSATGNREGSFDESEEDDEPMSILTEDDVARVLKACGRGATR